LPWHDALSVQAMAVKIKEIWKIKNIYNLLNLPPDLSIKPLGTFFLRGKPELERLHFFEISFPEHIRDQLLWRLQALPPLMLRA
jgi:hypothetical protein